MTWTPTHNNQTVGEWSDGIIDKMASKLKGSKKSHSVSEKRDQNEVVNIVVEFLPKPIQDAFYGDVEKTKKSNLC